MKRKKVSLLVALPIFILLLLAFHRDGNEITKVATLTVQNWTLIHSKRLQRLNDLCQASSTIEGGFIFDPTTKLAFCHIPKAASTWWLTNFARLKGTNLGRGDSSLHRIMLHNATLTFDQLPRDAFPFIFVRHPLKRLLSAYLDKFYASNSTERQKFRAPLVRFVRRRDKTTHDETLTTFSFPDFVDFVLDEISRRKRSFGSLHWFPMTKLCNVCHLKFVGKVETMSDDVDYLTQRFPLLKNIINYEKVVNKADSNYKEFYSQLTLTAKKALCWAYSQDFKLFGYSCDI